MDLEKLTPAPWEHDDTHVVHGRKVWPDGRVGTLSETPGIAKFNNREDAEFAALARNWLDVQVRRGWFIEYEEHFGWWLHRDPETTDPALYKTVLEAMEAAVEADREHGI
jgi:hypothetical protein